ncbi:MAG: response regulator [Thermodesulfobacteriota bacterium]
MVKKVLVVDDSPTELRLVTSALNGKGYNIITASDGVEAIQKVMKERPDLIVLDVVMPVKDGFQVCRELKKSPDTKEIKIVMLTSKNQETDRFWGMKQGADVYITKPFKEKELADCVAGLI